MKANRPSLKILTRAEIRRIAGSAWKILNETGVEIESEIILNFLKSKGFRTALSSRRVFFSEEEGARYLETAPRSFKLYDQDLKKFNTIGGDEVHFDPGSAAVYWLDPGSSVHRRALSKDCRALAILTQSLPQYAIQSTGIVPSDVPESLADCHRLIFSLIFCSKPVITGTFRKESFEVMQQMLECVAGGADQLRQYPIAIFDCCPSPPLKWSDLTVSALADCARTGIPAELVSMPLAGATAPVTLWGAVIQHCAESLSGIIIHQSIQPGAPIIWGGSPAAFDMRHGTPPMGSMETMMIDLAYSQVGKHFGLPTHAYMGCSDAKLPDYQAGMESGIGAVLAALGGINIVSGSGFLNYENTQSIEKLILDADACQLAFRLVRGIEPCRPEDAGDVLSRHAIDGKFLADPTTLRLHRKEIQSAGRTVSRNSLDDWKQMGSPSARELAEAEAARIMQQQSFVWNMDLLANLKAILISEAGKQGAENRIIQILEQELPPG